MQRVFRWFGHQPRCLWVLNKFSFRRHCRSINAERARARIAHRDSVESRDVLRPPMVFFAYLSLSSPAVSCASSSTLSTVSGSPGPAAAAAETASPLTVPFGVEPRKIWSALTTTESAKDVAVEMIYAEERGGQAWTVCG